MKFVSKIGLGLTLVAISAASYAEPKMVPCPPMELIKDLSGSVSYAAETAPNNYTVNLNSSFMYMSEKWDLLTLVIASNKSEALAKAKQNIGSTYHQYDLVTKPMDKGFGCGYIGKNGAIFAFTENSAG